MDRGIVAWAEPEPVITDVRDDWLHLRDPAQAPERRQRHAATLTGLYAEHVIMNGDGDVVRIFVVVVVTTYALIAEEACISVEDMD